MRVDSVGGSEQQVLMSEYPVTHRGGCWKIGGMVCSEIQVNVLEKMAISSPTPTTSYGCSLCRS